MIDHLKIVLTIGNLLLGSWAVSLLLHKKKVFPGNMLLVPLAVHTLMYNLLLWGALTDKYIRLNLPELTVHMEGPAYPRITSILFLLLIGGMTFVSFNICQGAGVNINPKRKRILQLSSTGIVAVVSLVGIIFIGIESRLVDFVIEEAGDLFFIIEAVLFLLIMVKGLRNRNKSVSHPQILLGVLYISRYIWIILLLLLPETLRFFLAMSALIIFNCIPLIWLRYGTRNNLLTDKLTGIKRMHIQNILRYQGITSRENELIQLVLEGKTNGEIEKLLYISPHTVKNHLYNIYRKMKVKNRYELISRLTGEAEAAGGD